MFLIFHNTDNFKQVNYDIFSDIRNVMIFRSPGCLRYVPRTNPCVSQLGLPLSTSHQLSYRYCSLQKRILKMEIRYIYESSILNEASHRHYNN